MRPPGLSRQPMKVGEWGGMLVFSGPAEFRKIRKTFGATVS